MEPCLKAMDLLNSALGLHEDMRSGTKPVPLTPSGRIGAAAASAASGASGSGASSSPSSGGGSHGRHDGGGPPRAGGEGRESVDLQEFLSVGGGGGGGVFPKRGGKWRGAGRERPVGVGVLHLRRLRQARR